jgi:hypothetical protein
VKRTRLKEMRRLIIATLCAFSGLSSHGLSRRRNPVDLPNSFNGR